MLLFCNLPYLMVTTAAQGELLFHANLPNTPSDLVPLSGQNGPYSPSRPYGGSDRHQQPAPAAAQREGLPANLSTAIEQVDMRHYLCQ